MTIKDLSVRLFGHRDTDPWDGLRGRQYEEVQMIARELGYSHGCGTKITLSPAQAAHVVLVWAERRINVDVLEPTA